MPQRPAALDIHAKNLELVRQRAESNRSEGVNPTAVSASES
ncbi:MAG: hypothetical protein ACO2PM_06115 [Pyrobaculum sp.]